jgi:hypothetical protein
VTFRAIAPTQVLKEFRDLELISAVEFPLLPPPSTSLEKVKMKYIHSNETLAVPEGGEYNSTHEAVQRFLYS